MLSKEYESHIGRVEVSFIISAVDLDPSQITRLTGLQPFEAARRGDERRNFKGDTIKPHPKGSWLITSASKVVSKDINDHIEYLLSLLLPNKELFLSVLQEKHGETYFDVLWTSNYLYAGTGPIISQVALKGMSDLGASIGFDIYQDELEVEKSEVDE